MQTMSPLKGIPNKGQNLADHGVIPADRIFNNQQTEPELSPLSADFYIETAKDIARSCNGVQLGLGIFGDLFGYGARIGLRALGRANPFLLMGAQLLSDESATSVLTAAKFREGDGSFKERWSYEMIEGMVPRILMMGAACLLPIPFAGLGGMLLQGGLLTLGGLAGEQISKEFGSQMPTTNLSFAGIFRRFLFSQALIGKGKLIKKGSQKLKLDWEDWLQGKEKMVHVNRTLAQVGKTLPSGPFRDPIPFYGTLTKEVARTASHLVNPGFTVQLKDPTVREILSAGLDQDSSILDQFPAFRALSADHQSRLKEGWDLYNVGFRREEEPSWWRDGSAYLKDPSVLINERLLVKDSGRLRRKKFLQWHLKFRESLAREQMADIRVVWNRQERVYYCLRNKKLPVRDGIRSAPVDTKEITDALQSYESAMGAISGNRQDVIKAVTFLDAVWRPQVRPHRKIVRINVDFIRGIFPTLSPKQVRQAGMIYHWMQQDVQRVDPDQFFADLPVGVSVENFYRKTVDYLGVAYYWLQQEIPKNESLSVPTNLDQAKRMLRLSGVLGILQWLAVKSPIEVLNKIYAQQFDWAFGQKRRRGNHLYFPKRGGVQYAELNPAWFREAVILAMRDRGWSNDDLAQAASRFLPRVLCDKEISSYKGGTRRIPFEHMQAIVEAFLVGAGDGRLIIQRDQALLSNYPELMVSLRFLSKLPEQEAAHTNGNGNGNGNGVRIPAMSRRHQRIYARQRNENLELDQNGLAHLIDESTRIRFPNLRVAADALGVSRGTLQRARKDVVQKPPRRALLRAVANPNGLNIPHAQVLRGAFHTFWKDNANAQIVLARSPIQESGYLYFGPSRGDRSKIAEYASHPAVTPGEFLYALRNGAHEKILEAVRERKLFFLPSPEEMAAFLKIPIRYFSRLENNRYPVSQRQRNRLHSLLSGQQIEDFEAIYERFWSGRSI
ncbi:MAG: hypothetical protein Q7S68_04130 [Deltaproteobacteria bacterium]|nr:hypothetical protein [Deltaproteobacteria bacterium]